MRRLFVYGTLRDPELFHAVAGRPLSAFSPRPLRLAGFRAARLAHAPFPALVRAEGASVAGLVLSGVDRGTLARLVRYEGPAYELRCVREHGALFAFVPRSDVELVAEDWRFEEWRRARKPAVLSALRACRPVRRVRQP
jgi:hypothetical protein